MIGIKTIGHAFAIAYHDVTTFFKGVAAQAPADAAKIQTGLAGVEGVANIVLAGVDPALLPSARGVEAIVGEVLGAISTASESGSAPEQVVVTIGKDLISGVQDLVALLGKHPAVAVAKAQPAGS